jgi:hypothetical protein
VNGEEKYRVIKDLVDHNGNRHRAAKTLGCTKRSVDRYVLGYKTEGKAFFIHGNSGRQPAHTIGESTKKDILDLYLNKYYDANFAHFKDLLERKEKTIISESLVRNILSAADVISPLATRNTKREYKKKLKAMLKEMKNSKEISKIMTKIVQLDEVHPRRPRCANFGEMIQMDASLHLWFGDSKATLHIAIDDATGIIVGARFELQETLHGYYHVFEQILTKYGIPYMFYTDRRAVFESKKSKNPDTAADAMIQFGYACKQLGVRIETTSVPEAKGRVERLIQTMQSRLPVELRLEGVSTIEQANDFLPDFIAHYNAKFALPSNCIQSVFETQPTREKIDLTLAVITERKVDNGHSIRFEKTYWRTLNKRGGIDYLKKGTEGLVIRSFSGELFYSVDDLVFVLEEIPEHERTSRNFDFKPPDELPKKKPYVPPPSHPWKLASFKRYLKKQANLSA